MNNASIGVLMLTAAVGLLGCSDPAGPEVVGEVAFGELTSGPEGTLMGDGVIFPETETIDVPGIVIEQAGRTIEVRGAAIEPCCGPVGVVELFRDQLTISITHSASGGPDISNAFAFRATTSDLDSGSYDVRVIYGRHLNGHEDATVVFTGTAEID